MEFLQSLMDSFQSLYNQTIFLLSSLDLFGMIDLLLVTGSFYLVLNVIRNSAAGQLLREVLIFGLFIFVLTALLPLPVFDWLMQGIFVALLVVTPIIFQAPIRRFLERVGRSAGITQSVRQSTVETLTPELIHAVEDMAAVKTGALVVLEGNDSLDDIAKSGIPLGGRVTNELLQSLFYSGTPLHDGAVVVRGDQIAAAGCVLPLTKQSLSAEKRLGTRHRAAVGVSEISDALAIVVSEETGHIGAAHRGFLERPLSTLELRDKLADFYDPATTTAPAISMWSLIRQARRQFWPPKSLLDPHRLLSNLALLLTAMLLAFVVWSFVIERTNPFKQERFENIPLRVENVPTNASLIPPPPSTVSAIVQTTEETLLTLSSRSFQAIASLEDSEPGLHRTSIEVNSSAAQVLVLSVDPPALDFELAPVISETFPVVVHIPNPENLPPAYEFASEPVVTPETVQVTGPAPLVEQVDQVQATISLANVTTSIRETRPVQALDEQDQEITGVTLQPALVQVSLNVRRRLNARDVSVNVVITGTVAPAYQITNQEVIPATITLRGGAERLPEIGNFINTLPIDVGQATSDLTVQIPLNLPPDIQAVDKEGNIINSARASIRIEPRQGNLSLTRPVELLSVPSNLTATLEPDRVNLFFDGPEPILNEIEANPDLVQVIIAGGELQSDQDVELIPKIIAPNDIAVQAIPPSILVTTQ